jgi:hypothetical protein
MLDGSRMHRRHVWFVRGFSPYATTWQVVFTGDLEEPICQRTNTNLSELYLFLGMHDPSGFARNPPTREQKQIHIHTQTEPERSDDSCSQIKTQHSDRIRGRWEAHRRRCWLILHRQVIDRFGEMHSWILYWNNWTLSAAPNQERTRDDLWIKYYDPMDRILLEQECAEVLEEAFKDFPLAQVSFHNLHRGVAKRAVYPRFVSYSRSFRRNSQEKY